MSAKRGIIIEYHEWEEKYRIPHEPLWAFRKRMKLSPASMRSLCRKLVEKRDGK